MASGPEPPGQRRLAAAPLRHPLDDVRRPHRKRLVPGETIEVVGQRRRRAVAVRGGLGQALQADQLQSVGARGLS